MLCFHFFCLQTYRETSSSLEEVVEVREYECFNDQLLTNKYKEKNTFFILSLLFLAINNEDAQSSTT